VAVGKTVTFSWTLANTGKHPAYGVVGSITLPAAGVSNPQASDGVVVTGSVATFTFDELAANAEKKLSVTLTVDAGAPEELKASASAGAANATSPRKTLTTHVSHQLKIEGTATPAKAVTGGESTYVWTVSNTGKFAAKDVVLSVPVPAGFGVIAMSDSAVKDASGVKWKVAQLDAGKQQTVVLTGMWDKPTARAELTLSAQAGNGDPVRWPLSVGVASQASLTSRGRAVPAVVKTGEQVKFVWTITNTGLQRVSGATAKVVLPSGATAPALTLSPAGPASPQGMSARLPDLGPGTSVTVAAAATITGNSDRSLIATLQNTTGDGQPAGAAAAIAEQEFVPVSVQMTGDSPAATAGKDISYTLTLRRSAPVTGVAARLRIQLPDGVRATAVTIDDKPAVFDISGDSIVMACPLAQDTTTVKVSGSLSPGTPAGTIQAEAFLAPITSQILPATAKIPTQVTSQPVLAVTTQSSPQPLQLGQNAEHLWTITNNGPSTAHNTSLALAWNGQEIQPQLLTLDRRLRSLPDTAQTATVVIGSLAPGDSATVTLLSIITPTTTAKTTKVTAQATADGAPTANGDITATINTQPEVTLTPPTAWTPSTPGDHQGVLVWTLTNPTRIEAHQVIYTLTLPTGLTAIDGTPRTSGAGATMDLTPHKVTWTYPTLPAASSHQFTLITTGTGTPTHTLTVNGTTQNIPPLGPNPAQ
ncbi:hypothetical protein ACGFYF_42200, partial [Streptomyces lavendulae]